MLYCNLAGLMANKKVNISDVNKSTKISRTTLTNLYYNHISGIQLETANELCKHFDVTLDKLFLFSKYDFEISMVNYDVLSIDEKKKQSGSASITLKIKYGNTIKCCDICAIIYFHYEPRAVELEIAVGYFEFDEKQAEQNAFLQKFILSLSDEFKAYFLNMIQNEIVSYYDKHNDLETDDGKSLSVKCMSISSDLW